MNRECFCCGCPLKEDFPEYAEEDSIHVERRNWLDATDWTTHGNWCSTAFDGLLDPDHKRCHIVICDQCFELKKDRIYFIPMTEEEKRFEAEQEERGRKAWEEIKKQIQKEKEKDA